MCWILVIPFLYQFIRCSSWVNGIKQNTVYWFMIALVNRFFSIPRAASLQAKATSCVERSRHWNERWNLIAPAILPKQDQNRPLEMVLFSIFHNVQLVSKLPKNVFFLRSITNPTSCHVKVQPISKNRIVRCCCCSINICNISKSRSCYGNSLKIWT